MSNSEMSQAAYYNTKINLLQSQLKEAHSQNVDSSQKIKHLQDTNELLKHYNRQLIKSSKDEKAIWAQRYDELDTRYRNLLSAQHVSDEKHKALLAIDKFNRESLKSKVLEDLLVTALCGPDHLQISTLVLELHDRLKVAEDALATQRQLNNRLEEKYYNAVSHIKKAPTLEESAERVENVMSAVFTILDSVKGVEFAGYDKGSGEQTSQGTAPDVSGGVRFPS